MRIFSRLIRPLLILAAFVVSASCVCAAAALPNSVKQTLKAQHIDKRDISISIIPLDGNGINLQHKADQPRIPASVEKAVTAAMALDAHGPAKVWTTRIFSENKPENGTLDGDLFIVGGGDPSMTAERFWLLIEDLRARGIRNIDGDLILDRSYFDLPEHDAFSFDGDGNRPYNLGADALLLNYRSFALRIIPDEAAGIARLYPTPRISDVKLPESIPLSKEPCGSWRKKIDPDYSDPTAPVFHGRFPEKCGPKYFIYTTLEADRYFESVFRTLWENSGGTWSGKAVSGKAPEAALLLTEADSQPLSLLLWNMNKFSNNLIARHLFLSVGETEEGEAKTLESSRRKTEDWARSIGIGPNELYVDNGSGLSRGSRLSARASTLVLKHMWNSPYRFEYVASFPVSGLDGTMKKRNAAVGQAHIKTGYLEGVRSIAGFVRAKSGRYYAVSAIINSPNAADSLPVMDSIIAWICTRG